MNKLFFVLSFVIAFIVGCPSYVAAQQSCRELFSGQDNSRPIVLPGAPAQLQIKGEDGEIKVFRGDDKVFAVRREDSADLSNHVFNILGDATLPGQGVRIGFEGLTPADAAQLMRNLDIVGDLRQYGIQEGFVSVVDNGDPEPPPREPFDVKKRYDFTRAMVTYAADISTPIAYEGSGARFIQDFVVDIPSTPSILDFIVRVLYGSKRAVKVDVSALDVITEALNQQKLSSATLRQAANEVIKKIRDVDTEWNAAIEGADKILVEVIFVSVPIKPA